MRLNPWSDGPDLVKVIVGALPGLHEIAVDMNAIGQVKTLALSQKSNPGVRRDDPILSWQPVETCPNLHPDSVRRVGASVQTKRPAINVDKGPRARGLIHEVPLLGGSAIAIIDLNGGPVSEDGTTNVETLAGITVGVDLPTRIHRSTGGVGKKNRS